MGRCSQLARSWCRPGHADTTLSWLSLVLGLLIAAFLLINEFPDYRADRAGGKRTLVVRLGRERAVRLRHEFDHTARIVPAQAATLIAFLLFALGAAGGLLLGTHGA